MMISQAGWPTPTQLVQYILAVMTLAACSTPDDETPTGPVKPSATEIVDTIASSVGRKSVDVNAYLKNCKPPFHVDVPSQTGIPGLTAEVAGTSIVHVANSDQVDGTASYSATAICADAQSVRLSISVTALRQVRISFELRDSFRGGRAQMPWSIRLGNANVADASLPTHVSQSDGLIRLEGPRGLYKIGWTENPEFYNAIAFAFNPAARPGDDTVKVLYERGFATDTIYLGSSMHVVARAPSKSEKFFDLGHHNIVFDHGAYGQQGFTKLFITIVSCDSGCPGLPTVPMTQTMRAAWFAWAQQLKQDIDSITKVEITTDISELPPVEQRKDHVYLFQNPGACTAGSGIGPHGELLYRIAMVPALPAPRRCMNAEGYLAVYGSPGFEDPLCRVPSVFNDPNDRTTVPDPAKCVFNQYYIDATEWDRMEGLSIQKNFAIRARARSLKEAAKLPAGQRPPWFSLIPPAQP